MTRLLRAAASSKLRWMILPGTTREELGGTWRAPLAAAAAVAEDDNAAAAAAAAEAAAEAEAAAAGAG
jgi:hypothetical protein